MIDAAIVGAGPSGLMLALLLARSGRTVRVLERQPTLEPPTGGVVLQPATLGLLGTVGILPALDAAGTAITGVDETGPAGPLFSGDYADLPDTPCPWALAAPLRLIREQLLDRLAEQPTASIQTGATVVALEQQSDHCRVDVVINGHPTDLRAAYVVGADGKYSTVRTAAAFDAEVAPFPDRQLIARMPRPAGWPARVRSHRAERPVVVVPSSERMLHVFGAVQSQDLNELADTLAAHHPGLAAELRSNGEQLALVRHHTVTVRRWSIGRVVLLGDSAHSVHPYGGQGMNLGLQDAALLRTVLDRALEADVNPPFYAPTDGRAILAEFESIRRPFVERFQTRQRSLLDPAAADRAFYLTDFADLALGQAELRPLFADLPTVRSNR